VVDIPKDIESKLNSIGAVLLCMYGMEVIVKEALLKRPKVRDQTRLSDLQRLEGLDSILTAIERWIELFLGVPAIEWIGATYGMFAQFSHCTILLFRLTALDEPDWDRNDVMKRANLLDILERVIQRLDSIPLLVGLVDSGDPEETGIFFKSARLLRVLKATFSAELAQNTSEMEVHPSLDPETPEFMRDLAAQDDIEMFSGDDPWWMELLLAQETIDL